MKPPTHHTATLDELAAELRTDTTALRRALIAKGLHPSTTGPDGVRYDRNTATFLWLASQAKASPTKSVRANITATTPAITLTK
jgi:hypothetical protein